MGIVLMLCATPVIITDLRAKATAERLFRPETAKCLQVLALIVGVFLVLPILGFSVGLALVTGGGMRLMGRHGWLACGATVIGTAVCIHFLFGRWLAFPCPRAWSVVGKKGRAPWMCCTISTPDSAWRSPGRISSPARLASCSGR